MGRRATRLPLLRSGRRLPQKMKIRAADATFPGRCAGRSHRRLRGREKGGSKLLTPRDRQLRCASAGMAGSVHPRGRPEPRKSAWRHSDLGPSPLRPFAGSGFLAFERLHES